MKSDTYTKKRIYDYSPKKIEDGVLPKNFLSIARNEEFVCFEKVKGEDFIITYEDKKILIYSDSNSSNVVKYFNDNLTKPFSKLVQFFDKVDFCLYGEYISDENCVTEYTGNPQMFFYDLYINDSWIKNDDMIQLFSEFGLPVPPVVKKGMVNECFIKALSAEIKNGSRVKGMKELYGFYIKSLNGLGRHSSLTKGAFFYYSKKFSPKKAKGFSKEEKKTIKKKVEELADFTIDDETIVKWDLLLRSKGVRKDENNLGKIMPILVQDYINNCDDEIQMLAAEEDATKEESKTMMKKYLPKIILKKFFGGNR